VYSESSERESNAVILTSPNDSTVTRDPLVVEPLDDRDLATYAHGYRILLFSLSHLANIVILSIALHCTASC
jgi:hypothetical protein